MDLLFWIHIVYSSANSFDSFWWTISPPLFGETGDRWSIRCQSLHVCLYSSWVNLLTALIIAESGSFLNSWLMISIRDHSFVIFISGFLQLISLVQDPHLRDQFVWEHRSICIGTTPCVFHSLQLDRRIRVNLLSSSATPRPFPIVSSSPFER